ncbi:MAG: response regulator receiver [Bacteroidetes bacterium]|nr:MAG: response regulator receiver [Bacteroidota bacterium]
MKKLKELNCILLVDDDEPTNFLHKNVIENAGIKTHVQTTESGDEALEYLTCTGRYKNEKRYPQPGIIFLDINMPRMNGWEFLEEYKKLSPDQQAKIIIAMLTTSLNPDDEARSKKTDMIACFLNKPLTVELINKVRKKYFNDGY